MTQRFLPHVVGSLELPFTELGRMRGSRFGRKNQEFGLRPVKFQMPLRSPSWEVSKLDL